MGIADGFAQALEWPVRKKRASEPWMNLNTYLT